MSTSHQPVTVHIQTGAGEIIRIVATLLLFGGTGMLVWTVAQGPMASYASTAAAAAVIFFASQLWKRGAITAPSSSGAAGGTDVRSVATSLEAASAGFLRRCSMPLLLVISLGYGLVFLAVREALAAVLSVVIGDGTAAGLVSIALTAAGVFFVGRLWERNVAGPRTAPTPATHATSGDDHVAHLRSVASTVGARVRVFLMTCHVGVLAAVAITYGIGFLVVREVVVLALGVFQNIYIAGGCALLVGSIVVMPTLIPAMLASLRQAGVVAPAQTAQVAAPQVTPAAPASPVPTPIYQGEPAPSAPKPTVRVVRRVKKKESDNV